MEHGFAVIMAGGRGERFWPLSTRRRPKQVLDLVGGKPLIVQAAGRVRGLIPPERVLVVTSASLVAPIRAALPELPEANIVGEPVGRDTAAACALASAIVRARDPRGVFCILTADHVITDEALFRRTLRAALERAAGEDVLITMGIRPTFPATGYGYIEAGATLAGPAGVVFRKAARFVEKPSLDAATGYIATGRYFWNSGIFVWSADSFQRALEKHRPVLLAATRRLEQAADTAGFAAALAKEYEALERISVDYAVMEHADNIVMVEGTFPWCDVGSWPAIADHFPADERGNVLVGRCEALDGTGNVVVSRERLTALIGVDNLVVVQAEGATLVCHKDRAQDVKKMVALLEGKGGYDALL